MNLTLFFLEKKIKGTVFVKNKAADLLLVLLSVGVIIIYSLFSAFLYDNVPQNKEYIQYLIVAFSVIIIIIRGIFPTLKKPKSLIHETFPVSSFKRYMITLLHDFFNLQTALALLFICGVFIFSTQYKVNILIDHLIIIVCSYYVNLAIRSIDRHAGANLVIGLILVISAGVSYFDRVSVFLAGFIVINSLLYYRMYRLEVYKHGESGKSTTRTNRLALMVKYKVSNRFIVKLWALILLIKIVSLFLLSFKGTFLSVGTKQLFLVFLSPILIYNYIHSNIIGLTKPFFFTVYSSSDYFRQFKYFYFAFIFISAILDLTVSALLFSLIYIGSRHFEFLTFLTGFNHKIVIFYFTIFAILSPYSVLISFYKPLNFRQLFGAKSSVNSLYGFFAFMIAFISAILYSWDFAFYGIVAWYIFISFILLRKTRSAAFLSGSSIYEKLKN